MKDMVNVRPYNNKQQLLFPPCIGDFIPEDDYGHIIEALVENFVSGHRKAP
jgi:hypothetical protein